MVELKQLIDPEPSEYHQDQAMVWLLLLPPALSVALVELWDSYGFGPIVPSLLASSILLRLAGDLLAFRNRRAGSVLRVTAALGLIASLLVSIANGVYAWNGNS